MGIARAVGRETVLVKALVWSYSLFTCHATIGLATGARSTSR